MKYFYLNIFLISLLFFVFSQTDYSNAFSSNSICLGQACLTPTVKPTLIPTPTPTSAPPIRLIVPKLSIDTAIEPVSVGVNNIMEVPDGWDKAGWYTKAVKPGEVGTSVIIGHYDNQFGAPAIFYYLKQLEEGDKLIILTADGKELDFTVIQKSTYPFWSSIDDLLISGKDKNLILITCAGWWNQEMHNYSEKLVVQAVL